MMTTASTSTLTNSNKPSSPPHTSPTLSGGSSQSSKPSTSIRSSASTFAPVFF
ncbi:hypothetical protein FIBSPDRAFT_854991 [Athelia psychrophila]|uniref:Uncharacterized protein n=1 Tax=Athelia psychrophila TaxID=1759441 RepID=A0A166PQS4_9AGAM|nr:hypothetical protein FIBSPDRAFT_854991 [Fibularhizoctonia sp. CBS 109695]